MIRSGARIAGVLGGMGPAATVDFLSKVQQLSAACRDQDHIRLIIDLNPQVPDRNEAHAIGDASVDRELAAMARGLERAGAHFLVLVCNTAHRHRAAIEAASTLPFVSMIDETVAAVRARRPRVRAVGLLATPACVASGLYQHRFASAGITVRTLQAAEERRLLTLVYRIKAGAAGAELRPQMEELAHGLAVDGAELLIAACTEVPLALSADSCPVPLIDSTEVLAERTVAYARGEPLPEGLG